ncbi:MAG: D-lyxose/D-mannose family sugar isomerase, partial [Planctomycetes bacterium]|nr:D-lyxose/D-mannose family sugar isomerase [Planctomycetota bacterium]
HHHKMEDIVNRGGGNILIKLTALHQTESARTRILQFKSMGKHALTKRASSSVWSLPESLHFTETHPSVFGGTGHQYSGRRQTIHGEVSRVCDDLTTTVGSNRVKGFVISKKMSRPDII